uniref:PPM-type phosphatase domain-containing protein n=1 Tax=Phaeomonas parva TaxID=124430 RepID=A0A7S1UEX6_9STRA
MGVYLSTPNTEKHSEDGAEPGGTMVYGACAMQGWRKNMEDEHVCLLELGGNSDVKMFGVFDGHGGKEVARFCGRHMPSEMLALPEFGNGEYERALKRVFHRMDELLEQSEYQSELDALKSHPLFPSEEERREMEAKKAGEDGDLGDDGAKGQKELFDMLKGLLSVQSGDEKNGEKNGEKSGDGATKMAVPLGVERRESMASDDIAAAEAESAVSAASNAGFNVSSMPTFPCDEDAGEDDDETEYFNEEPRTCLLSDHSVRAGCTSIVSVVVGNKLYTANAGDSRGVLCRRGLAVALSYDHKPKKKREFDRINAAEGFVNRVGRVNGNLNLSRSIGDLKYKQNTSKPPEGQIITAEPDVSVIELVDDDEFFVLACDGVWDCMTNQQCVDFVRERLNRADRTSQICEEMLDFCIADDPRKTTGIGGDNMSVVIIKLK